ncbi:LysR family transcriptional regulator [Streptomyces sp. NPDC047000]|uniref:LysR family transcriptional regulator n=1 Tax=Streptomyces sp. NPDC047000 TaxID=3155474 RepID=UPI0033C1085F
MDVETRELRYFVAVAEELHFGRAAHRLGIAQPPLSRAIRLLERRMGVTLLERTSREVRLTAAGEVLLTEGRGVLGAVAAAVRRTRRAAAVTPRLVLALKPGGDADLLRPILDRYAATPGAVPVELAFSVGERAAMVRDGRADLALLHRPQNDLSGLDSDDLHAEGQVVVLPDGHPLADRTTVSMADLRGETQPRWPEARPGVTGQLVTETAQLLQLILLGRMVAVLPESVRDRLPPGTVSRPVTDAEPATLVIAWPRASTSREVAAFVRAATSATAAPLNTATCPVPRAETASPESDNGA